MKTKLCIIFPSDPLGAKIGGAESYINDFIKFAPEDFEIEFIGVTSDKNARPVRKWTRIKIEQREFDFYPLFFEKEVNKKSFIPLALCFSLMLKRSRLDFQNKIIFLNRIEPALFLRHIKTPKIGVIHSNISTEMFNKGTEVFWNRFPWLYFKVEKIIFKSLDRVYSVSRDTVEFYWARYSYEKEKFSFLPTWVATDIFFPLFEQKETLRRSTIFMEKSLLVSKKWILFVGRLQEVKAPLRLIDAFFEYYRRNQESSLIIIGEGNLRIEVERHIKKLNLGKDVFLLGQIARKDLVNFYRAADSLLLTSNFEGMPLCVLEALACGLPVVTTDVGEVKRVIKSGYSGEVINSFVSKDLAQGLEKVLNNPEIYTRDNCVNAVKEYTPQNVLKPAYEMIRKLYKERFASDKQ